MTGHESPRCCAPGTTVSFDLGHNAAQIRRCGGFILAWKQAPGAESGPYNRARPHCRALVQSSECRTNYPISDTEHANTGPSKRGCMDVTASAPLRDF